MADDIVLQCPPYREKARRALEVQLKAARLGGAGHVVKTPTGKLRLMANTTILMKGPGLGNSPDIPRAFPGAEGLAANTRGAAGYSGAKSVAIVTNLDDSGAGSFRDAVAGAGKEGTFVTFEVSGIINLTSPVYITSSYVTVAGQTSPGGICFAGSPIQVGNQGVGNTDVIIRHIRSRAGTHEQGTGGDAEAFRVWSASNVMIDHCSFSWGGDETSSVTAFGGTACQQITYSHCMITQGLDAQAEPHAYGLLFNFNAGANNSGEIHNSYIAHMNGECRMPKCAGTGFYNIVNNVIYNYERFYTMQVSTNNTAEINMVGNYVKPGPNSEGPYTGPGRAGEAGTSATFGGVAAPILYMQNNFGVIRDEDSDNEWCICSYNNDALLSTAWQSLTEFSSPAGSVAITKKSLSGLTAESTAEGWLADMGATKPARDSHDTTMVNDFVNGTGTFPTGVTYPDDWPTYSNPSPPTDSNDDGISDAWAAANMGGDNWNDAAPSGYLWIEEYINSLA